MTEQTATANHIDEAHRLTRRRAGMLPILACLYLGQQAIFAALPADPTRAVDYVKIGAWLVLTLILLAALTTKGFWLHSKALRNTINDESTRAHRADALSWGFILAMLSATSLYVAAMVTPISPREAIHVIVSLGLAVALVRFGLLEWRALRDA